MKRVLVIIALVCVGCATQPSAEFKAYQRYVELKQPLARSGALSWSKYYEGLYDVASKAGAPGHVLSGYNQAIKVSLALEAGTISSDDFAFQMRALQSDSRSRQQADQQAADVAQQQRQTASAKQIAASVQLLQQSIQPQPYAPAPAYTTTAGSPLRTTTYSNGLRYCHYFNGSIQTVSNSQNCPNTSQ